MQLEERIEGLNKLGEVLRSYFEFKKSGIGTVSFWTSILDQTIKNECNYNPFFTEQNVLFALKYWANELTIDKLNNWLEPYKKDLSSINSKKIAIISAGNIPLVSFHDIVSVFLSGHYALVKLSSKDARLPVVLWNIVCSFLPAAKSRVEFIKEKPIHGFDAVIATGNNLSQQYFGYYFGKYPHVFRHHRNAVAVLTGDETQEELELLANDIFTYFGLGCRSVSKLYLPKEFDFSNLMNALKKWDHLFYNHHYLNNYEYQKSLFLINKEPFIDGGFVMLKESNQISSPLGVIFYEYYSDICILAPKFEAMAQQIQCIVSKNNKYLKSIELGKAQRPELWEYADNIDIVKFLIQI
ncbi:MAG TPA: hypothetical protein PLP65_06555 [Bacteroidales bacterium]|jgi:hypothetical protein|nr:hypothetical protein [Bacteroidales bacterium]